AGRQLYAADHLCPTAGGTANGDAHREARRAGRTVAGGTARTGDRPTRRLLLRRRRGADPRCCGLSRTPGRIRARRGDVCGAMQAARPRSTSTALEALAGL